MCEEEKRVSYEKAAIWSLTRVNCNLIVEKNDFKASAGEFGQLQLLHSFIQ